MSNSIEVVAIVEGKTESIFIKKILAPYFAQKSIFMTPTQVSKKGQRGGDVTFERVINDIVSSLKQRPDTYVTTIVDYYGIKQWPGVDQVSKGATPLEIANIVNEATKKQVLSSFSKQRAECRFIPYIGVHEFEALLFSDSSVLAKQLSIKESTVKAVLKKFETPEAINNSPETSPSKRLDAWSKGQKFPKTTLGISTAKAIGIETMRENCSVFNNWLTTIESILAVEHGNGKHL